MVWTLPYSLHLQITRVIARFLEAFLNCYPRQGGCCGSAPCVMWIGSRLSNGPISASQAWARCGFFFATVALFPAGFLEDLASDFLDSIWAKLRRICSIKSGAPVTCLRDAGNIGMRLLTS